MRKRDERFAEQAKHKAAPDPLYDKRANADQPIRLFRPQDFEFDSNNLSLCTSRESELVEIRVFAQPRSASVGAARREVHNAVHSRSST